MELIIQLNNKLDLLPEWFMVAMFFLFMWAITLFLLVRKDFPVKNKKKQRKVYDWIYLPWCYIGGILGSLLILIVR